MDIDQEVCLCFHVTLRKLLQYLRVAKPHYASQLSKCSGAGTGCGWCRPFLERLHQTNSPMDIDHMLPDPGQYLSDRADFLNRQDDHPNRHR